MRTVFHFSLIVLLWTVCANGTFSQVSKVIEAGYPLTDDGEVFVVNKFGNIEFNGWSKDSVYVRAELHLTEEDDDIVERFDPKFNFAEEYLEVTGGLSNKSQGYFSRLFRSLNPLDFNRSGIDIHVVIYMPEAAHAKVENKYGDVIINDCSGRFTGMVEHGDIRISGRMEYADVQLKFGLFRAFELERGLLEIDNGRVDIATVENLQLNSTGTEIEVDSVKTFRLGSQKDVISLKSAGTLTGDMRFSEMQLELLNEFMDLSLHQSQLNLFDIGRSSSTIHLNQKESEIEIRTADVGVEVEAQLEGGLLRLPKQAIDLNVEVLDEKKELRSISAKLGTSPYGRIVLKGKDGFILIK